MANPNWARWFFASFANYLKQVAVDANVPVIVEGLDDRSDAFMQATDRVEVRVNGPYTREISKGYFEVKMDANVLITSRFDGTKKNGYRIQELCGLYHEAMDGVISIYKFGLLPGDDEDELVGCLDVIRGKNNPVRVLHFGQISKTDRIKQSMVDARYIAEIDE